MKITVKRAYDQAAVADGYRVLADRLWPRGVSKAKAKIDLWAKDATPSAELRSWFHEDPEGRFKDFSAKYRGELAQSEGLAALKKTIKGRKTVTLVTAAKDVEHSHIPTLIKYLTR
jgi:uncharacterized protein YeaO (DUF488 family)